MELLSKLFVRQRPGDLVTTLVAGYARARERGERVDPTSLFTLFPALAPILRRELSRIDSSYPLSPLNLDSNTGDFGAQALIDTPLRERTIGPYQLLAELGSGAMGAVYKARHLETDEIVALKTLHSGNASKAHVERLGREAAAQRRLAHPNIARIYETGIIDDVPFVAMELVGSGESLAGLMRAERRGLGQRRAAEIAAAIADAMAYSHDQGIIHRDIKPSNILLDGNTPKLTDFGLAFDSLCEDLLRLTRTGETLGTLSYMPPEQIVGSSQPKRSWDIYGIGATLYELLASRPPFLGESAPAIMHDVLHGDPPPLIVARRDLHRDLEAICIKCLEKRPDRRYASCAELRDDLRRFLSGEPVQAPRVNWTTRRLRLKAAKRKGSVVTGVIIAALLATGFWFTRHYMYGSFTTSLGYTMGRVPVDGEAYDVPMLVRALRDESDSTRSHAVAALCRANTKAGNAALLKLAAGKDEVTQIALGRTLRDVDNDLAPSICRELLRSSSAPVVAVAGELRARLNDPHHAAGPDQTAAGPGLVRHTAFVNQYLQTASPSERQQILRAFLDGASIPLQVNAIINVLESANGAAERELAAAALNYLTGESLPADSFSWRRWWAANSGSWRARAVLEVVWAPPRGTLQTGDVIWTVDGEAINPNMLPKVAASKRLVVVRYRDEAPVRLALDCPCGSAVTRAFFVAELDGAPVGHHPAVSQWQTATPASP